MTTPPGPDVQRVTAVQPWVVPGQERGSDAAVRRGAAWVWGIFGVGLLSRFATLGAQLSSGTITAAGLLGTALFLLLLWSVTRGWGWARVLASLVLILSGAGYGASVVAVLSRRAAYGIPNPVILTVVLLFTLAFFASAVVLWCAPSVRAYFRSVSAAPLGR